MIKFSSLKSRPVISWVVHPVGILLYRRSKAFWDIIGAGSTCYMGPHVPVCRTDFEYSYVIEMEFQKWNSSNGDF